MRPSATDRAPAPVFVLGMHRSGTSALAGVLARLGFALGTDLVPPRPGADDPELFEDRETLEFHEDLLAALGRQWQHPLPLPADWLQDPRLAPFGRRLAGLVDRLAATGPWAVKDPRLCLLFPLWRAVLEARGVKPRVLLCVREPAEVVASLAARDGMAHGLALQLWCTHVLAAERASRGLARRVVDYRDLVNAPHATVANFTTWLGVEQDEARVQAACESVRPRLWRQRAPADPAPERAPGHSPVSERARGIAVALRDPPDQARLDTEWQALAGAIAVIGPALEDQYEALRRWQAAFEEANAQLATTRAAVDQHLELIRAQDEAIRGAVEVGDGFAEAIRQIQAHRAAAEQLLRAAAVLGDRLALREREITALRAGGELRLVTPAGDEPAGALTYQGHVDLRVENNAHSRAARYIRETVPGGRRVLEAGCASGYFGAALRDLGYEVWGVEPDTDAARVAAARLDRVYEGEVEAVLARLDPTDTAFDFVVFGDVLEHLVDPAAALRACVRHLASGGRIVASVPNVAHAAVRLMLMEGRWDHAATGILDATHLHFYTRDTLVDLFSSADLAIERLSPITLAVEQTGIAVNPRFGDAFASLVTDQERDVFQFVVMAQPVEPGVAALRNRRFKVRASHRILCLPPAPASTLTTIRLTDPLQRLVQRQGGEVRFGDLRAPDYEDVEWCDTVVLQREASPYIVDLARRLRAAGKRVVLDIDDYLLEVPAYLSVHEHCRVMRPHLEELLATVDAVSASTAPLRDRLLAYNARTFVTPNQAWTSHPPIAHDEGARSTGGVVRVLVASSDTVRVDFLVDVLRELVAGCAVELVGIGPPGEFLRAAGLPVAALPLVAHEEFKAFIAARANTIALVPLDDQPFNRCKSAVKYFDYALAGVPVVASAIEPYATVITDGEDGLLCPDDGELWLVAARSLVADAGLRARLADKARRRCVERHDLDRAAAAWQELLVVTAPREAGTPSGDRAAGSVGSRSGWQLVRGTIRHVTRPSSWHSAWQLLQAGGIRELVKRWKTVF